MPETNLSLIRLKSLYHIVKKRRQDVYNGQPANTENKQAFRADPAVDIQKVSAVIPPSLPVMHRFQKDRSKIFHTSADSHDTDKFQDRFLSQFI